MAMGTMQELMLEEIREIYSAERLALRAYPRLRKIVRTPALREAIERHVEQTNEQVERLGRIFESLDAKTRGKTCHAVQGLIEEAQEHLDADLPPEMLEVMLVGDLQKIEHYEIAAYGTARAHAEALGMDDVVELLEQTLEEEKQTDEALNRLAIEHITPAALGAAEEEEEGEEAEEGEEERETERQEKPRRASRSAQSGASASGSSGSSSGGGSGGGSSGGEGGDLKSREFRDKQGNVHHHTRTKGKSE